MGERSPTLILKGDAMLFRCQTCGTLLTDAMCKEGFCVGHRVKLAIRGTFFEWLLLKVGLYEAYSRRFLCKL